MLKITLDPGHGPKTNQGYDKEYFEGANVFTLAHYLKEELLKYEGVEVVVTREYVTDNPDVNERGKLAANNGSDVFISLHTNGVGSSAACGVTVFRSIKRPDSIDLGKALGEAVVVVMAPMTGNTYLRGVVTREEEKTPGVDYYGVIRNAATGVNCRYIYIIEHGFHSNPKECAFLKNDANKRKIAEAEAKVIASYFGLAKKETAQPEEEDARGKYYRVQLGAFKNKDNATAYAEKLKEEGYSAIVRFY